MEKRLVGGFMNRRFLLFLVLSAGGLTAADSSVWKVAGPPPESWQRDRVADLASRRMAAMEQLGSKAVLVLYAAEPRNRETSTGRIARRTIFSISPASRSRAACWC
jgi:hypothetical protein